MAGPAPAEWKWSPKDYDKLLGRLKNPQPVLKTVGLLLVAQGQEAFKAQRFGAFKWPQRYQGVGGKYINAAGALADVAKGGSIKKRRTADRVPALSDTGMLRKSLTSKSESFRERGAFAIEYGTNLKYAGLHQTGGFSYMHVTQEMKSRIRKFLKREKSPDYWRRFGKLFARKTRTFAIWRTRIHKRPFIGITDKYATQISSEVARVLATGRAK